MQIIRDKQTKVVVYMFSDADYVSLTECLVTKDFKALDINQDTHEIVENVEFLENFIGGAYKYIDTWEVFNQELIDEIALEKYKASIPQSITPLQAKLQLFEMGLLDEVEALVSKDRKIQLYWEYALEIRRDNEILNQMATSLSLTQEDLDKMLIEANKII